MCGVLRLSSVCGIFCLSILSCLSPTGDGPCIPQQEECNGIDDDCDSDVDEDENGNPLERDCSNTCGDGTESCEEGSWVYCTSLQPSAEVCDGIDNDCNGQIDESCLCRHGDYRSCGRSVGICGPGVQHCDKGEWTVCQFAHASEDLIELCNDGLDNDCDGAIDEECRCIPGETQSCGIDVGECQFGEMVCLEDATWDEVCAGEIVPELDICDTLDNDCDGVVDSIESIGFGWSADAQEPNDRCVDASPLFDDLGRNEIHEGDWVQIQVDSESDLTSYPTLYGSRESHASSDEDWYSIRVKESADTCIDGTRECAFVISLQLWLPDRIFMGNALQLPEDYQFCVTVGDCAEGFLPRSVFCTDENDWYEIYSSYLMSLVFGGECARDDSRDLRIQVLSPTGKACGHYQLYIGFRFDNRLDCP